MMVSVGASFLLCGLVGAVINSCIMKRVKKFKLILLVCMIGGTVAHLLAYIVIRAGIGYLAIVFAGLMGFFEVPCRGHIISFQCEVTYPASMVY